MQTILKRTAQNQRQAARKAAKQARRDAVDEKWYRIARQQQYDQSRTALVREARRARADDWLRGPLAAKRDVGARADSYGAFDYSTFRPPDVHRAARFGIVEGDRVVVVRRGHRDEGKIGKVTQLIEESEACAVENVNVVRATPYLLDSRLTVACADLAGWHQADLYVPEAMRKIDRSELKVRPTNMPIPLRDVRLVAALPQPDTGELRDVVVKELKLSKRTFAQSKGEDPPTRAIAGVHPPIEIPYPAKPEEPDYEEADCDTYRIEVEERTFAPSLRAPPMPPPLIDELRGKYSKFRTRHDEEYMQRKEEEARMEKVRKEASSRRMLTPLQEWRAQRRKERRERGWPGLDEDAMERIGEAMERNLRIEDGKALQKA